jgi:hypothetical protein
MPCQIGKGQAIEIRDFKKTDTFLGVTEGGASGN